MISPTIRAAIGGVGVLGLLVCASVLPLDSWWEWGFIAVGVVCNAAALVSGIKEV